MLASIPELATLAALCTKHADADRAPVRCVVGTTSGTQFGTSPVPPTSVYSPVVKSAFVASASSNLKLTAPSNTLLGASLDTPSSYVHTPPPAPPSCASSGAQTPIHTPSVLAGRVTFANPFCSPRTRRARRSASVEVVGPGRGWEDVLETKRVSGRASGREVRREGGGVQRLRVM